MRPLTESAGIRKQRANHKRLPKFKNAKREPVLYKRPDGNVVADKSAESVLGLREKPYKKNNMSDLIYHSTPIRGEPYKKDDWKKVAVHSDTEIKGFFGPDYYFLSCWYPAKVVFDGVEYPSAENAYQAQKVVPEYRSAFAAMSAEESKKSWKYYVLQDKCAADWDARKADVMYRVVKAKFAQNKELQKRLADTGNKYLEAVGWWKDTFYEVDIEHGGQNILGKILMRVRTELAAHKNHAFHEKDYCCPQDDFKYGYGRQND